MGTGDPDLASDFYANFAMLRSVPHWLRGTCRPILWPDTVKALGFTGIPVPAAPSRPETAVGHPLGVAKGAARTTRAPERLLG